MIILDNCYKNFEPIIQENFLDNFYADGIENIVTSSNIRWKYLKDVTSNSTKNKQVHADNYGFGSSIFDLEKNEAEPIFYYLLPLYEKALYTFNLKDMELIRVRLGLNCKKSDTKNFNNSPHIDYDFFPHLTLIYYVNNVDGPTTFYQKINNTTKDFLPIQQIFPKKGKIVLFNGLTYHSSSTPTLSNRFVINFNFTKQEIIHSFNKQDMCNESFIYD